VESVKVIDNVAIPIFIIHRNYICVYLVPFSRYSKLLVESSEFFVPHLYLVPPLGVTQ